MREGLYVANVLFLMDAESSASATVFRYKDGEWDAWSAISQKAVPMATETMKIHEKILVPITAGEWISGEYGDGLYVSDYFDKFDLPAPNMTIFCRYRNTWHIWNGGPESQKFDDLALTNSIFNGRLFSIAQWVPVDEWGREDG